MIKCWPIVYGIRGRDNLSRPYIKDMKRWDQESNKG